MFKKLIYILSCIALLSGVTAIWADNYNSSNISTSFHREFTELSGVARAQLPGQFWVHNDSDPQRRLWRINQDGEVLATVRLPQMSSVDWEDIARFTWREQDYLLIADVGNNHRNRPFLDIHFINTKHLPETTPNQASQLRTDQVHTLRYRMGSYRPDDLGYDCEAVAVSTIHDRIILLTKTNPVRVYQLPLSQALELAMTQQAKSPSSKPPELPPAFVGELQLAEKNIMTNRAMLPTALDISPDGQHWVISSSELAWVSINPLTHHAASETLPIMQWLQSPSQQIKLPWLPLIEGAAFTHQGDALFVASEFWPASFAEISLPQL